jgi:hypothetical protein
LADAVCIAFSLDSAVFDVSTGESLYGKTRAPAPNMIEIGTLIIKEMKYLKATRYFKIINSIIKLNEGRKKR